MSISDLTNLYPDGLPISDGPKWPWPSPPVSEDDHALVCAERDKLRQQLKEANDGVAMNAKLYHAASQERDDYRARFRDLERELEIMRSQLMAMQERAEKAEAQLAAVPVDAMLECIGPDGYDFTAPTLTVLRFANWLEAERAFRR